MTVSLLGGNYFPTSENGVDDDRGQLLPPHILPALSGTKPLGPVAPEATSR